MADSNTTPPLNSGSNTNPTDPTSTTPTDTSAGLPADSNAATNGQPNAAPPASTSSLANPDANLGSGSSNGAQVAGLVNQSASYRNAIIIASAVSGAIGLILVFFVVWMVYRRRNRRKTGGGVTSGNAGRPASDSSWVGPRLNPSDAFNDDKLEAGDRGSRTDSLESGTTLDDGKVAHKKSGSFGTLTTYSPRPSMDKLRITTAPLVSHDPFQAPQMSIILATRPSLERPAPPSPLTPRPRRGLALRVESSGNFNSGITVEQANPSPDIPLVTPIDAWRSPMADNNGNLFTLLPPPARRDSMASLSRQSSRASSRNSPVVDNEATEVASPRKKANFSVNVKKRRHSRADSIDPFRKSATSMKVRRKSVRTSRTDVLASRGASYNNGGVVRRRSSRSSRASRAPESGPSTPGSRRKSRVPSVASSRRSQTTVNETRIFARPLTPSSALQGLPANPRPPSSLGAVRQSAYEGFTFTPSLGAPPISHPGTPGTAPLHTPEPQTPRTPGGHARRPKVAVPRTPTSLEDAHWRSIPLPEPPATARPVTPRPLPAAPNTPQSASVSGLLSRPRTPQTASAVPSRPRTPQGASVVRPPPKTPRTPKTARAELRLSQLSRTLSEVSRESDYMGKAF